MPFSPQFVRFVGYVGAAANWTIPIAAMGNLYKQPATSIDPVMTSVLACYSMVFFRWSIAIAPPNYPLMLCHTANATLQLVNLGKYAAYGRGPTPDGKPAVRESSH